MSAVALLLIFASFVWRLHYGVNLSDEALHVGIPLRFALGATPFIDEVSSVQTYALVTWPLASIYLKVRGATDAIVLAFRIAFACLWLLLAGCYWLFGRRYADIRVGMMLAAGPLVCVPANIPSLSYLTIGMFAFSILALLHLGVLTGKPIPRSLVLGVVAPVGLLAYPPALPALLYMATRSVGGGVRYSVVAFSALTVAFIAGETLDLGRFFHDSGALEYIKAGYSTAPSRWGRLTPLCSLEAFVLFSLVVGVASRYAYFLVLPLSVAATFLISSPLVTSYSLQSNLILILVSLLLVSEVCVVGCYRDISRLVPLRDIVIATLLAYSGTAYFSDYPATCAILWFGPLLGVLVVRIFQRMSSFSPSGGVLWGFLSLYFVLWNQLQGRYTWEEDSFQSLTERIVSGPYAYLKTSPHRARFLSEFEYAVSPLVAGGARVVGWGLVAPSFLGLYYPAEYSLATLYPDMCEGRQKFLVQRLIKSSPHPLVALRTSFSTLEQCSDMPLDKALCENRRSEATLLDQHLRLSWWSLEKGIIAQ